MRRLIPIAILIPLILGCAADIIRPRVERGIRNVLPIHIGPAEEYKVQANGPVSSMVEGLIAHLHIEGTFVEIDTDLIVDHMLVDMEEVRYDPNTRDIKSVRNTIFQATLSANSVNRYVESTGRFNQDYKLKLSPGKVEIELLPAMMGINMPVTVTGRPAIADGDKVNFVADSASVARLPVPAFVISRVMDSVNPILDMSTVRFPVSLHDIQVEDDAVVIKGRALFKPAPSP